MGHRTNSVGSNSTDKHQMGTAAALFSPWQQAERSVCFKRQSAETAKNRRKKRDTEESRHCDEREDLIPRNPSASAIFSKFHRAVST